MITYMRTDSLRLSDEAMDAAAGFIRSRYGNEYYYGQHHVFKTKAGRRTPTKPSGRPMWNWSRNGCVPV